MSEKESKNQKIDISKWEVDPSDFELDPDKGTSKKSGANGIVTFCIQKSTGKKCVKKKTIKRLKEEDVRRNFDREVHILGTHKHPALVELIGYYEQKKSGFIILKTIDKGSLDVNIKKNNKGGEKDPLWDDTHILIIAYGVACAMEFIQSDNIVHRDLKPSNILLDSKLYPYVTDFGTSKQLDPSLSIQQTISGTTPIIMAPEFFEDPFNTKDSLMLDYYAYGITIYHLITGLEPFEKYALLALMNAVTKGERPPIPDYVPSHWKKLIEDCWRQNPTERPNFTEICDTLESKTFVNDSIDKAVFNAYKKIVKPLRPSASLTSKSSGKATLPTPKPKVKKDDTSASAESSILVNLREEAKKGTNFASILAYADALFTGKYGPQDLDEACNQYLRVSNIKECPLKEKCVAEYYAGQCYSNKGNYERANNFLTKSVHHGNPNAAYFLANLILTGKVKPDKTKIDGYLRIAADAGIPEAIKQYALLNYSGYFTGIANVKKANEYFKLGSDNGDPELVYIWAVRTEFGRGEVKKDVKEAMKLMRYAAEDLNYTQAQFDYALHLFNGINVPKDLEEAEKFFEMAAIAGHPTAMLYHYLYLSKSDSKEDLEAAAVFCDQMLSQELIDQNKVDPDAWAINGLLLLDQGDEMRNYALQNLQYAMSAGSILAINALGHLAEEDEKTYGPPSFYYERSAHHCHCLDTIGFTTPIEYKVFHCDKCNQNMCEGCAKHCHRGHSVYEVTTESGFKCECGAKGFKGQCTSELLGEECCYQHLYQCINCQLNNDSIFICKSCAEKCHKNHRVIDCGIQKCFCSCGMKRLTLQRKCKLLDFEKADKCSVLTYWTEPTQQRWFGCLTCNLFRNPEDGICFNCAKACHKDHTVIDLGVQTQSCKCMVNNKCIF